VTNGRGGASSKPEEFGTLADVAAGQAKLGFVFQDDFIFAVKPRKKLVNEIKPNERRAVETDEEFGVERILEIVEGAAERVSLRAAVKEDVVAVSFDPGDVADGDEAGAVVAFDEDAIGIGALLLNALQDFGKTRGEWAGRTRVIFARAAEDVFETVFGEGLQEIVEGVDFEGAEGVVIVSGDENDGRHVVGADGFDNGETVARRHLDVEENEIGLQLFDGGHGGVATGGFTDDLDVGLLTEKAQDFATSGRLVIYYENFERGSGHYSGESVG